MRALTTNNLAVLLSLVLLLAGGCSDAPPPKAVYQQRLTNLGELFFYLQPLPQEMLPITFSISEINAITEQGKPISLLNSPLVVTGSEYVDIQRRLLSETLPPGRYTGLALTIDNAVLISDTATISLAPPPEPLALDLSFSIAAGRSQALFLFLSPEFLLTEDYRFTPRFVLGRPVLPPSNFLGFVSQTDRNIITVFNKKTMEAIEVLNTGIGPKGMALDQRNGVLYVANAGDSTIELFSLATMERTGRIRLNLGDEPTVLALSPDGQRLFSVNYGSASISLMDTRSMTELNRYAIDPDPVWIVAGNDGESAYVLHSLTSTVSVINARQRTRHSSISLDVDPFRGALSRTGEELYVISHYGTELQVVDLISFSVLDRIFIGGGSTSIAVDPRSNLIYVSKRSGEVIVVDPDSRVLIDGLMVGKNINFLTIDGEENMLFLLKPGENRVQKLGLVSKRQRGYFEVEGKGNTLSVMGQF